VKRLIVGADVGGTSTRVAVADLTGHILGSASGGPANPVSVGRARSAAVIRAVTAEALEGVPGDVVVVFLGLAGGLQSADDAAYLDATQPERVPVRPQVVSDLSVAFSSATPLDEGYVVIAGTGAVAGHLVGGRLLERRDGWGWLLGDQGSGFWLGREAVRRTLRALERSDQLCDFHHRVLEEAGAADREQLIELAYAHEPHWLARFAPLVSTFADQGGDPAAIASQAANQLAEAMLSLRPEPTLPIVLAGSVLTTPGAISASVRASLSAGLPNPLLQASRGVVGALWLAARSTGRVEADLHRRLTASAERLQSGS
jgi:glucosamine kinase